MNNSIDSIAKVLLYKGPTPKEIITEAISNNYKFDIINSSLTTKIIVKSIVVYNVKIIDEYTYDNEENLVKHIIRINNKESVIFDKYEEAKFMLHSINEIEQIAS